MENILEKITLHLFTHESSCQLLTIIISREKEGFRCIIKCKANRFIERETQNIVQNSLFEILKIKKEQTDLAKNFGFHIIEDILYLTKDGHITHTEQALLNKSFQDSNCSEQLQPKKPQQSPHKSPKYIGIRRI